MIINCHSNVVLFNFDKLFQMEYHMSFVDQDLRSVFCNYQYPTNISKQYYILMHVYLYQKYEQYFFFFFTTLVAELLIAFKFFFTKNTNCLFIKIVSCAKSC